MATARGSLLGRTSAAGLVRDHAASKRCRCCRHVRGASFRTEVDVAPFTQKLSYGDPVALLGSCFADNVGTKLRALKFDVVANPYGTIYNPASLALLLERTATGTYQHAEELVTNGDLWFSYSYHSKLSAINRTSCVHRIETATTALHEQLRVAKFVFVTLGTAWVYTLTETSEIVCDCHKMPASLFQKRLLSVPEVEQYLLRTVAVCSQLSPQAHVIFTVSPVRHWKDGAVHNQVSKSTLLVAVHNICCQLQHRDKSYFPAYELMLDDLRDYRFYDSDMLHPNAAAVSYIWDKLQSAWLAPEADSLSQRVHKLQAACQHRVLHPGSKSHRNFVERQLRVIRTLQQEHAFLDLTQEQRHFEQQLQPQDWANATSATELY